VLLYVICAGASDRVERVALPNLREHGGSDSEIRVLRHQRSLADAYNGILDEAVDRTDLEAIVFLHDDVRVIDPDISSKIRRSTSLPAVAIVGVIGGTGPSSMSWASGSRTSGSVVEVFEATGSRRRVGGTTNGGMCDVDTVDGLFMAFSPWAIAHLRFDNRYPPFDGYDADICAQARHCGMRVIAAPILVEHVNTSADGSAFLRSANRQAALIWAAKWRTDCPRWRREIWRARARFLRFEFRLRGLKWRE
jgi:hypothetical protein